MKKFLFAALLIIGAILPLAAQDPAPVSAAAGKGGVVPCLASWFMGDVRLGYEMNEGKPVQTYDWINLGGNLASGALGYVLPYGLGGLFGLAARGYTSYDQGYKNSEGVGFCVAFLWGPRPGRDFKTTKLRSKEIGLCIPLYNIIPCVMISMEMINGKTYTEIIQTEALTR